MQNEDSWQTEWRSIFYKHVKGALNEAKKSSCVFISLIVQDWWFEQQESK